MSAYSYEKLSRHLHTPECDTFIRKLIDCNLENKWSRFLGKCNEHSTALNQCLAQQRELRRIEAFKNRPKIKT